MAQPLGPPGEVTFRVHPPYVHVGNYNAITVYICIQLRIQLLECILIIYSEETYIERWDQVQYAPNFGFEFRVPDGEVSPCARLPLTFL